MKFRSLLALLIMALFTIPGFGQEKLNKLVQERQSLHQEWRNAESKKSGIFGNRTKKDMTATNDWLERIVNKDNQIMAELEMLKKIETTEIGFEKDDYKFIAQKQEQDIGKLKRVIAEREKEILQQKSEKRRYEWMTFIFFLLSIIFGYLYFKQRSK